MDVTFLLVDALNLIRRIYAAQPGDDTPERAENARMTTAQSLQRALRECTPTHAVCVFDSQEKGWRHREYPQYKEGRRPMPEALHAALPKYEETFEQLGIPSIQIPKLEADDVIATFASKVASRGGTVTILSTDKIFFQLLTDRIKIRNHFLRHDIDGSYVLEHFQVRPDQFVDFLALTGDSTNNVKGVPSVGPKTAARLLAHFDTLEDLLTASYSISGKPGDMIRTHCEDARRARRLTQLCTDLELGYNLTAFRYGH